MRERMYVSRFMHHAPLSRFLPLGGNRSRLFPNTQPDPVRPVPSLVPPNQRDAVAQRFRLLGEPVRLQLLSVLHAEGEQTVGDLVDTTGHRQANVSKHLSRMAEADLLSRRRDGVHVYYSISDPTLTALCQLVRARLDGSIGEDVDN